MKIKAKIIGGIKDGLEVEVYPQQERLVFKAPYNQEVEYLRWGTEREPGTLKIKYYIFRPFQEAWKYYK